MFDNTYVYVMDCSLDKKGNVIVYEIQPFVTSKIGPFAKWNFKEAFQEKFSDFRFIMPDEEDKEDEGIPEFLIQLVNNISETEYSNIKNKKYTYLHTPSFEYEINPLNSKINQRLYLPEEVSPKHLILNSDLTFAEIKEKIICYCKNQSIQSIVLKSGDGECYQGDGNYFISNIKDIESNIQGIEALEKTINSFKKSNSSHFLVEEAKIFPRISRKNGEEKQGHITYRIIGIANKEGNLGYFIATKSISQDIDSHKREKMKCFFGTPKKTHPSTEGWIFEAQGIKDKYFNRGEKSVGIRPELIQQISKQIYKLYADINNMNPNEFKAHINKLIIQKYLDPNKNESISNISDKNESAKRIDEFHRACHADYHHLAGDIAKEIIKLDELRLDQLCNYELYRNQDQLRILLSCIDLNIGSEKLNSLLETANKEQLEYILSEEKIIPIKKIDSIIKEKANKLLSNMLNKEKNLSPRSITIFFTPRQETNNISQDECSQNNSNNLGA